MGSEEAFKLVGEAFRFLSDKVRKKEHDMKLRIRIQDEKMKEGGELLVKEAFWTACSTCRLLHQFEKRYVGHNLVCPSCRKSFKAVEVKNEDGNVRVRVRSQSLTSRNSGGDKGIKDSSLKPKPKMASMGLGRRAGSGEKGKERAKGGELKKRKGEMGSGDSEKEADGGGEWGGGRLRKRMSSVGEVLKRSESKRSKSNEEMMTLAEMQLEAKRKLKQVKIKLKLKEKEKEKDGREQQQQKEKEKQERRGGDLKRNKDLVVDSRVVLKKSKDLGLENNKDNGRSRTGLNNRDLEIMAVEDSDFYDFDKDRVERSFKQGHVWAIYDDDDGMPRHYGLIDDIVSVNPFEVKMSWLDLQSNGDDGLVCLEKMGFHVSCGRFKVSRKTSINSVNVFSHVADCERVAREVYMIYPKKGSVWALYNEAAKDAEGRNLSVRDKRSYDIVVLLTTYSEMHGLSMAYLEKVDGFKTIFKRCEIGSHAIRWLEKDHVRLFSHQIPARKLSGNEAADLSNDCWELDPASLPPDLLTNGQDR